MNKAAAREIRILAGDVDNAITLLEGAIRDYLAATHATNAANVRAALRSRPELAKHLGLGIDRVVRTVAGNHIP